MDLNEAYELVRSDAADNKDVVSPVSNIYPALMSSTGQLGLSFGRSPREGQWHPFTDWGEKSYLAKVGVPFGFYKKCSPDLQLKMTTEFHGQWSGSATIRMKKDAIRFVGSDKYTPIDNIQIMEAFLKADSSMVKGMKLKEVDLRETSFVLRGTFNDPIDLKTLGRSFRTGIQVINSETGCAALKMQYILYEELCTNGLVAERFAQKISRVHKRAVSNDLLSLDLDILMGNMSQFHDKMQIVLSEKSTMFGTNVLEALSINKDIPDTVKTKMLDVLPKYSKMATDYDPEISLQRPYLINVMSAFTEAVQDPAVSRLERVRLESLAGRLLGI